MNKKHISVALSALMLFGGAACGGTGKAIAVDPESLLSEERFVVFADLPCTGLTEEGLKDYMACGFNVYALTEEDGGRITDGTQNDGGLTSSYASALEKLNEAGLDVFIRNHRNDPDYFVNTGEDWDKERTIYGEEYTLPYRNLTSAAFEEYDNFAGIMAADEPAFYTMMQGTHYYHALSEYEKMVEWQNTYFEDKYFHMNLFPRYPESSTVWYTNPENPLEGVTYEEYVDYYVENFAKKLKGRKSICLDNYPFRADAAGIGPSYYENLLLFANKTKECNDSMPEGYARADFGICIQSFYDATNRDILCAGDISFQLCVGMALGARTFQYYLYSTIGSGEDAQVGIMDKSGNKRIYDFVREANAAYLPFERVLTSFEWQGAATFLAEREADRENAEAFADMAGTLTASQMGKLKGVRSSRDCIVGYYEKEGLSGYMVTNCSLPSEGRRNIVLLDLPGCEKAIVYTKNGEYETVDAAGGSVRLVLEAGGGAFVVPL